MVGSVSLVGGGFDQSQLYSDWLLPVLAVLVAVAFIGMIMDVRRRNAKVAQDDQG